MAWRTHPGSYRCVYTQSADQGMQCLGRRHTLSDTAQRIDNVVQFLALAEAIAHSVIPTCRRTAGEKQIADPGESQECQRRCPIGCSYPGHLCKPARDQHYARADQKGWMSIDRLGRARLTRSGIVLKTKSLRHTSGNGIYVFESTSKLYADWILPSVTTVLREQPQWQLEAQHTNGTMVDERGPTLSAHAPWTEIRRKQRSVVA